MSTWLVVPVKSLRNGKSRLSAALDGVRRPQFLAWLLRRTLRQAAQFPGLDRTLVVSACEQARACATACGARVLQERAPGGLNSALEQAQRELQRLGASRMLMASCDLPLLSPADLEALAAAVSAETIAIAPDRSRQGTNAIGLDSAAQLAFGFGPGSFAHHLNGIRQIDKTAAIVERAGLAFDIDFPEDLGEFRAMIPALAAHRKPRSVLESEPPPL